MSRATDKRIAVVTGSNKGIGYEIVRQLASNGIDVVLTARDESRGLEAVQKLNDSFGHTASVFFHQLDVADPASIISLSDFLKTQFGKVDILVNNAGILGVIMDVNGYIAAIDVARKENTVFDWTKTTTQTSELAEECLQINYYGTKRTTEALIPLLQSSVSPRIVNVSASMGKLENISNDWAKGILSDVESLTEERIDEVLREFMKDFKEGTLESKGWPTAVSAYVVSKAAMNAYTRIQAKKHPNFRINCVCPGYVKTDMNYNTGYGSVEEGAAGPVKLALLPNDGPTGMFFYQSEVSSI